MVDYSIPKTIKPRSDVQSAWEQFTGKHEIMITSDDEREILHQIIEGLDTTKAFVCIVSTVRSSFFSFPTLTVNEISEPVPAGYAASILFWQDVYFSLPSGTNEIVIELQGKKEQLLDSVKSKYPNKVFFPIWGLLLPLHLFLPAADIGSFFGETYLLLKKINVIISGLSHAHILCWKKKIMSISLKKTQPLIGFRACDFSGTLSGREKPPKTNE